MHSYLLLVTHAVSLGCAVYLTYVGVKLVNIGFPRLLGAILCGELGILVTLRRIAINLELVSDHSTLSALVCLVFVVVTTAVLLVLGVIQLGKEGTSGGHSFDLKMAIVFTMAQFAVYILHYFLRMTVAKFWEWSFHVNYPPKNAPEALPVQRSKMLLVRGNGDVLRRREYGGGGGSGDTSGGWSGGWGGDGGGWGGDGGGGGCDGGGGGGDGGGGGGGGGDGGGC